MNDPELLAALESGRIPVGFLYRHKTDSTHSYAKAGDWEYYQPGTPGEWHRGESFRDCCHKLMEGR